MSTVKLTAEDRELIDHMGVEYVIEQHVEEAIKACATAFGDYVSILEKIHHIYGQINMDTPEDQALHLKVVKQADDVLHLVKTRLGLYKEVDDGTG